MNKKQKDENIKLGIIIDTILRIPPNTGVTYRLYYLSKKLAENGVTVKIFICNRIFTDDKKIENLLKEKSIEFHIIPEEIFYNPERMSDIIKSNSINILQVEDAVSLIRYNNIGKKLNIPMCLEMHDVEASLKELLKYDTEEIENSKKIARQACILAEKVICMTKLDKDELVHKIKVDGNKIEIVPNPIDLQEFQYYENQVLRKNIIFIGNMFYWPNKNAVELIAENIYPKINTAIKNVNFIFVGMVPKEMRNKYSKNNFIFTGSIDKLDPFLKKSAIALCPVVEGSGMKVKILNYCAAGIPVITTKIGSSGYEKVKSLIVEDNIDKYPKIIIDLFKNSNKIKTIGKKNREAIEKYYNLDKIANTMTKIYQNIINNFYIESKKIKSGSRRNTKLPLPLWLDENRTKKIENKNYYIIKNGKIIYKKELHTIV